MITPAHFELIESPGARPEEQSTSFGPGRADCQGRGPTPRLVSASAEGSMGLGVMLGWLPVLGPLVAGLIARGGQSGLPGRVARWHHLLQVFLGALIGGLFGPAAGVLAGLGIGGVFPVSSVGATAPSAGASDAGSAFRAALPCIARMTGAHLYDFCLRLLAPGPPNFFGSACLGSPVNMCSS